MVAYASSHVTTRNPGSPLRRIMGSGMRPRALSFCELASDNAETSARWPGSRAGEVFNRISSKRTMQRWTPSTVQSLSPVVPNAQPSQTPWFRIRHAKRSCSRFSHAARSISQYWFGLRSIGLRGTTEAQSDGFQPMLHPRGLSGLNRSCSESYSGNGSLVCQIRKKSQHARPPLELGFSSNPIYVANHHYVAEFAGYALFFDC